jgi:hypothetical protein
MFTLSQTFISLTNNNSKSSLFQIGMVARYNSTGSYDESIDLTFMFSINLFMIFRAIYIQN